jgi:hypothetical protein
MAVPHRDDVTAGAALGPNDHHHSAIEESGADPTNFAVVKPVVRDRHRDAGKHLFGIDREIDTTMLERPIPLGRIVGRFHAICVTTSCVHGKRYVVT